MRPEADDVPSIDRVYVNDLAVSELGWRPKYDFQHVLDCLRAEQISVAAGTRVGSKVTTPPYSMAARTRSSRP